MPTGNRRLASQMMNPMEISLADEVRKTLQAETPAPAQRRQIRLSSQMVGPARPVEKKSALSQGG